MTARDLVVQGLRTVLRAVEGQVRPGPYALPITGGFLPDSVGRFTNWWQMGYDPSGISSQSAMVEACVSAYSQTVAMLPGAHRRLKDDGGAERVTNSALSRILKRPNDYQSISDFMLNATRFLYSEGNAYALALRNDRFEITSLHLMDSRQSFPQLAVTGDVFYRLGGNDVIAPRVNNQAIIVPARDVLHIRLHCVDRKRPFPLRGETPLLAALLDMAAGNAITQQQLQFYMNQARPSAVLSTDAVLKQEQVDQLRQMWNEQAKGLEAGCGPGGTPILTAGLKVQAWATPSRDAQLAEMMKLSDEKVALAFRVPLQILGVATTRVPFHSTEILMQSWIASGLGFCLNHVEEAFGLLFQLKGQPDEYVEFDTKALLRSSFKERIEAYAAGVIGGVFAPNETRAFEGLPKAKNGDEPRLQAQVVPLSAAAGIPALASSPTAPAAPAADIKPADKKPDQTSEEYAAQMSRHSRELLHAADRFDRQRHVAA